MGIQYCLVNRAPEPFLILSQPSQIHYPNSEGEI